MDPQNYTIAQWEAIKTLVLQNEEMLRILRTMGSGDPTKKRAADAAALDPPADDDKSSTKKKPRKRRTATKPNLWHCALRLLTQHTPKEIPRRQVMMWAKAQNLMDAEKDPWKLVAFLKKHVDVETPGPQLNDALDTTISAALEAELAPLVEALRQLKPVAVGSSSAKVKDTV